LLELTPFDGVLPTLASDEGIELRAGTVASAANEVIQ